MPIDCYYVQELLLSDNEEKEVMEPLLQINNLNSSILKPQ